MDDPARQNPALEVRWSGMTDKGRFRKNNEDAFLGLTFDAREVRLLGKEGEAELDIGDFVFAVSDGMGGANGGEFASRIAVDKITQILPPTFRRAAAGFRLGGEDILVEIFTQIHDEMATMGRIYEECRGMGATLSLCWLTPEKLYFAHVGDSRIYHLPVAGGMHQITHDHTHVGRLRRQGKLTELQARLHPARGGLEMVLGGKIRSVEPQVGQVRYESGDRFFLCSDGINDGIGDRVLEGHIRNPPAKLAELAPAERLVREAMATSRDNLTALLVEIA